MLTTVLCTSHHGGRRTLSDFVQRVGSLVPPARGHYDLIVLHDRSLPETERGLLQKEADWHCGDGRALVSPAVLDGRRYASVVFQKYVAVDKHLEQTTSIDYKHRTGDGAVVFLVDPDYAFNPHALVFAENIMNARPDITFLSLLKGYGPSAAPPSEIEEIGGFRFTRWGSCMGGAMVVRWSTAAPLLREFFDTHQVCFYDCGSGGMFDQIFWEFLFKSRGMDRPVYTLVDFSLMQHCNQISSFLDEKGPGGVRNHEYGLDFDPLVDPILWVNTRGPGS